MREQSAHPLSRDTSKPSVCLVVPPSPFTVPKGWGFYLQRPFEGVSYISTVLKNAGYPVAVIDARFKQGPLDYVTDKIKNFDVVQIATFEDGYPFVKAVAAAAKEQSPKRPVILGGSLVTSLPAAIMKDTAADIAVISEGELTVLELMDAIVKGAGVAQLENIPGLCLKSKSGDILFTGPRLQMSNLDVLPAADFSVWPGVGQGGIFRQVIVSGSRGCHKNCSFCYRTTPRLGLKSPAKLHAELSLYKKKHHAEFFQFVDLTFTFSRKRTLALCEVLKDIRVKWWCMTRVQNVDPQVLGAMADSGCEQVLYGVESVSQSAIDQAHKGFTESETIRALQWTKEAGITVGAAYVIGLPGETRESLSDAVAFSRSQGTPVRVKYLSAIPGTEMFRKARESGVIKDEMGHLNGLLARERGVAEDEFLNLTGMPETVYRDAFKKIEANYVLGPYGSAQLIRDKRNYAYPGEPLGANEVLDILAEDEILCGGSLIYGS